MMLTALLFAEAAAYVLPHLPSRANGPRAQLAGT
jgi:hypothetical protein